MIKQILLSILVAASFSANAQSQDPPYPVEHCKSQIPFGQPQSKKQTTALICRKAYFLEHDNRAKIPLWVSYVLQPQNATGCEKRLNAFKSDRSLGEDERAELKDYAKSGYDTGHIANSADMSWDYDAARESFILSNMAPQLPEFNRGIWKRLEDQTRAWSYNRNHPMLVQAGPIYNVRQDKKIGKSQVTVPDGFFKIVVDLTTKEALVFKFKHEAGNGSLNNYISRIEDVQRETGITFQHPKSIIYSTSIWPSQTRSVRNVKKEMCE